MGQSHHVAQYICDSESDEMELGSSNNSEEVENGSQYAHTTIKMMLLIK